MINSTYVEPVQPEKFGPSHSLYSIYGRTHFITPSGFKATEFRPPVKGENFLSVVEAFRTVPETTIATNNFPTNTPRLILVQELSGLQGLMLAYGTVCPKIPEGWEAVCFREVEVDEYFLHSNDGKAGCVGRLFHSEQLHHKKAGSARLVVKRRPLSEPIPRHLHRSTGPSVLSTYGTNNPIIPEGYYSIEFRAPKVGELFLGIGMDVHQFFSSKTQISAIGPFRIIVGRLPSNGGTYGIGSILHSRIVDRMAERNAPPPPPMRVRMLRVLEYIGPETWIEMTCTNAGVKGTREFGSDRFIRELSVFKEEIK